MHRIRRGIRRKYCILTVIIVLVLILFAVTVQAQPMADAFSQDAASNAAVMCINDTINEYLQNNSFVYGDLSRIQTDENGHITAISIQTELLNMIKTGVASAIAQQFAQMQIISLKLPIGTLLGNGFFAGKGIELPYYVTYTATAKAELKNMFITRGINQTQHRIILDIEAEVKTFSLGKTHTIPVKTQVTVAETVIVGTIPEIYAGADDELWPNLVE